MTQPHAAPLAAVVDARRFGGKAAQLGAALRAGLPVPDGVALDGALVAAVAAGDAGACAAVERACAALDGALAVRSSAVGEDSAAASFAGQHLTRLGVVGGAAVIDAVAAVWRSGHAEAARAYRLRMGADAAVAVGVVVQRLVPADVAGVLFTRNPVSGADERVIEASWGLGEAIVQGLVIPDRYHLAPDGAVLGRLAGNKVLALRRAGDGGTRQEPVAPYLARMLCLSDARLARLGALAAQCDAVFDSGLHDIEWAFAGDALFLLQRRPITVTAARRAPAQGA